MKSLLVTGGAGFIGSALIRQLIDETDWVVVNVDALTYAGGLDSLAEARESPRHIFERVDIRDAREVARVFHEHRPDAVVHLAAETHVDRSIHAPTLFVETNVIGTCHLLESARLYWTELTPQARDAFRFHLVSTDEVYGDLGPEDPPFDERSRYAPSSPYAATKAAADHLVRAWHRTYALPTLITHSSNSYGPHQTRDKLIPLTICNALEGNPLPVYGGGTNIREWLYVDDHVRALRSVLVAGTPGRTYDIGGHSGCTNLEVVQTICTLLDRHVPRAAGPYADLIRFVADRPGHDRRYAVDDRRVREELAWREQVDFDEGLKRTVRWYLHRYGREWKP